MGQFSRVCGYFPTFCGLTVTFMGGLKAHGHANEASQNSFNHMPVTRTSKCGTLCHYFLDCMDLFLIQKCFHLTEHEGQDLRKPAV